jgi:hypothetical protein
MRLLQQLKLLMVAALMFAAAPSVVFATTAPAAPTNLTATAGDGSATISFTAGSDGGSPITNYKYSRDGGSSWWALSPSDTTSPITITGLTNGTPYSISILAVNSVGDGQPSQFVSVTPQAQSLNNIISSDPLFWSSSPDSPLLLLNWANLFSNFEANQRLIFELMDRLLSDLKSKKKDENYDDSSEFGRKNIDDINIVSLYGDQVFASTKGTNGLQITGFELNADDNGGFLFSSMNYLSVANGWRRAGFAELNYRDTEGVGSTLSMNGRMSWERYANATTMYGYFLGADVQRSNLQSGAPGRQNTWGAVAGAYVIAQAENGVIGSAYGGIGLNANDLFMDDGTVTVTDQYGTQSIMMGASVSGEIDRQSYLLRPSVSASFGQTYIGDLSMTQTTGGNSTAFPVSGGTVRFFSLVVEPEFVFKINASAVGQGLSEVTVAPRLTCERREAVTGTRDCGSGLALNLTRASSDGLTTVNAGLSFDRIGGQDRSSAKLQLQMAF